MGRFRVRDRFVYGTDEFDGRGAGSHLIKNKDWQCWPSFEPPESVLDSEEMKDTDSILRVRPEFDLAREFQLVQPDLTRILGQTKDLHTALHVIAAPDLGLGIKNM